MLKYMQSLKDKILEEVLKIDLLIIWLN